MSQANCLIALPADGGNVDVGEQVTRGGRYGLIRFGSRVDLYVPTSVTPLVTVGEKTTAGLSAVARMPVGERA